jgi:RNA polymerase sigma-70 factor (ECF subfamily)
MNVIERNGPSAMPGSQATHSAPPLSAEQVYYDYAPRVYNMARRMVSNDVDAEDVTQDVLLQVVRKLPTFRGESAFPTWLHRVTVNAALAHRRKRACREEHRVRDAAEVILEDQGGQQPGRRWLLGPDVQMLDRETRQLLEGAIDGLPEKYRETFLLADVEGLPNSTVAASLGLSLPAMKSRLHRARLLLRDALAPHFGEVSA